MTQYRIQFTNVTAFGNKKASTVWMNILEEVKASQWINELDAEVITRTKPESAQTFAQWKQSRQN